jgi:hypothetical protein
VPRAFPDIASLIRATNCPRHCEPTGRREAPPDDRLREAIHSFFVPGHGLLRCARNDGGYSFAISRRIAPEVCNFVCPLRNRGRREDRVLAAPAISRAICAKQKCTRAYRAAATLRPSLRNGFTAYFVLSPVNGSFATVAPQEARFSKNLTPAPRRQNHTTSPYA